MKADVSWERVKQKNCLVFRFGEDFTETDALQTIHQAHTVLKEGGDSLTMIWDCRTMKRYDAGAREAWQQFVRDLKPRIDSIHLVSDNLVVRMGGTTVGIFAGIRVRAWKCISEIPFGTA